MKKCVFLLLSLAFLSFVIHESKFTVPVNFPKPIYDFSRNTLTEDKILLGRTLFYDPILSKSNTISCESCHSPFSSFTHVDHSLSHGIHDSIGIRNSPALFNLAWQKSFMWDGSVNNLDMQALAPISHPAEMGSSINEVVSKLNASTKYRKLFFGAYQDSLATGERTLKAISQFLLTLVSANSKYDQMIRKELNFTEQEKRGYLLFRKNCSSCHKEPMFTNNSFENNGLPVDIKLKDIGRIKITANPSDSLKFKVPSLRNIEYTYPYMHDGRFKKLSEVLNHYTNGIQNSKTLSNKLKHGVVLSSDQKADIIKFLLTLSDKEFVFNKNNQFPS